MSLTILGTARQNGITCRKNVDNTREYRQRTRVRSTDVPSPTVYTAILALLRANGIYLGAFAPLDSGAWVSEITCNVDEGRNLRSTAKGRAWDWNVDITFSSKSQDQPKDIDDPSLQPPTVHFSTYKYTSPATRNYTNQATGPRITDGVAKADGTFDTFPTNNSANDPISRERRRGSLVIKISKVFKAFDPNNACEAPKGYLYSRNRYVWNPLPAAYLPAEDGILNIARVQPGCGRIEDMTVSPLWSNGLLYLTVDTEVHVDDDKFADIVLDQGFTYLGPDGKNVRITDAHGWATSPQNLDGSGHRLAVGAAPISRSFQYYPVEDWADLSIP